MKTKSQLKLLASGYVRAGRQTVCVNTGQLNYNHHGLRLKLDN